MQLNCSLQMPVEPTDKIFEQFENETEDIQLNAFNCHRWRGKLIHEASLHRFEPFLESIVSLEWQE